MQGHWNSPVVPPVPSFGGHSHVGGTGVGHPEVVEVEDVEVSPVATQRLLTSAEPPFGLTSVSAHSSPAAQKPAPALKQHPPSGLPLGPTKHRHSPDEQNVLPGQSIPPATVILIKKRKMIQYNVSESLAEGMVIQTMEDNMV